MTKRRRSALGFDFASTETTIRHLHLNLPAIKICHQFKATDRGASFAGAAVAAATSRLPLKLLPRRSERVIRDKPFASSAVPGNPALAGTRGAPLQRPACCLPAAACSCALQVARCFPPANPPWPPLIQPPLEPPIRRECDQRIARSFSSACFDATRWLLLLLGMK